jgi:hypothetical protein
MLWNNQKLIIKDDNKYKGKVLILHNNEVTFIYPKQMKDNDVRKLLISFAN